MGETSDKQMGAGSPRHRLSRFERSPRFADSFGLVLLLLISSFFVLALAGDTARGREVSLLILAATAWLALRASQVTPRILRLALALIPLATVIAIVLTAVGNEQTASIVAKTLIVLLVVVAPVAILSRLVSHPVISVNTFFGAVSVYLLIAMFFATAFGLIALLGDQAFFAQLQPPAKATSVDYLYFSLVTITTVGYGDLTAASNLGRMMAIFEAVLGQLYLITVVALVVQNLGRQSRIAMRMQEELEGPAPDAGEAGPNKGAAADEKT
jgi:hypothetical protein